MIELIIMVQSLSMANNSLWITASPGDDAPEEFYAVIETPKGSRVSLLAKDPSKSKINFESI